MPRMIRTASILALALGLPAHAEDIAWELGGTSFTFYGQVNQGVLGYDDGEVSEVFAPVDNDNFPSLVGLRSVTDFGGWTMGSWIEVAVNPRSTGEVNILDTNGNWDFGKQKLRHAQLSFLKEGFGRISLGQGSMATDFITGLSDLSGTGIITGVGVSDLAGGQLVRDESGALTGGTVAQHYNNMAGSRRLRARYDTPQRGGFIFSAAYGEEVLSDTDDRRFADMAVVYSGESGDFEYLASGGYSHSSADEDVISGAAAVKHTPSGLNLAVAAGHTSAEHDSQFGYVKAGLARSWFSVGETALSVDYYMGADIYELGADSRAYSLAVVQSFDAQRLEVYGALRRYDMDGATTRFQDGNAAMIGLRWQF